MATKEERNIGIDMQQAFSILPNQILLDNRLDNKSKIIWVYIQGKPKDWDFSAERIAKQLNMGKTQTKEYLKELEIHGYLVRNKLTTGRVEYFLYCPPIKKPESENETMAQDPESEKATVRKSHHGNSDPISNKDSIVIKNHSNKEIPSFSKFWDIYPKKVGKKDALKVWLKINPPLEIVLEFIGLASQTDRWKKGFIPDPTTFLNQERWTDDFSYYNDRKNSKESLEVMKF